MSQTAVATRKDIEDVLELIHSFMDMTEKRFNGLEDRMDRLEERMDRLEDRMDRLEARMDRLEERMDRIEARMDSIELRLSNVERRLDQVEGEQRALRNDVKEFLLALTKVRKKVDAYGTLNPMEQAATSSEIRRLEQWATQLGKRVKFPFPLPVDK